MNRSLGPIGGDEVTARAAEPSAPAAGPQPAAVSMPLSRIKAARRPLGLGVACLLALTIGAHRITDEGYVSLHGDMPRHLMNGVFFLDVLRDLPLQNVDTLVEYTRQYYARYPALSLGHHPPLLAAAQVPPFALFGVSVGSARLVILSSLVVSTAFVYVLVQPYGTMAALLAAALFALSPHIVILSHSVLSEMLAVALLLAAMYFFDRFTTHEQRRHLVGFVVSVVLSLYAKQLAAFVFPVFLFIAVTRLGVRRLFRADLVVAAVAMLVLVLPLAVVTYTVAGMNVSAAIAALTAPTHSRWDTLRVALVEQFAVAALVLVAAGVVRGLLIVIRQRDWTPVAWILWGALALGGMVEVTPFEPSRYGIYAVPALCMLAGVAVAGIRRRAAAAAAIAVSLAVVGAQAREAFSRPAVRSAEGYEAAARFVLDSNPGATVLFSGDIDTGFFTFFVRKHDAARRLVVLRSDKLLTTSFMAMPSIEDRIADRQEIYGLLKQFGTRYVVIEDRPSASHVLEWLREELRTASFAERRRIRIGTSDERLRGVDLVIYEFLDATPPDAAAVLNINIPVVGQSVSVKLSDLMERRYLR